MEGEDLGLKRRKISIFLGEWESAVMKDVQCDYSIKDSQFGALGFKRKLVNAVIILFSLFLFLFSGTQLRGFWQEMTLKLCLSRCLVLPSEIMVRKGKENRR